MLNKLLLVLIALCIAVPANAQKQNNNWCFAHQRGISFNSGSPVMFTSAILAEENCAVASDRTTGNLLFYTNGLKVWDKNNNIMPNGSSGIGLDTEYSSSQGSLIANDIADLSKYFLFTVEANAGTGTRGRLCYSVVDMKLNGGLGDVVASKKSIIIADSISESMTLVPGNCCIWLLTHSILSDTFYAYKITAAGISTTPIKSMGGYAYKHIGVGYMRVSPNGKKLALASIQSTVLGSFIALHDFDISTGMVSNGQIIDSYVGDLLQAHFYALEFSPNSSKLYLNMRNPELYQFDISLSTTAAITASKYMITAQGMSNGLQLGPDSNLYVAGGADFALGIINNPNLAAPACTFSSMFHYSPPDTPWGIRILGLPQPVGISLNVNTHTTKDVSMCFGKPATLSGPAGAVSYVWQDGSTTQYFTATTPGTYWVKTNPTGCGINTDSFKVSNTDFSFDLGRDTTVCKSVAINLSANVQGASYHWQDGSSNNYFNATTPGTYTLKVTVNGCSKTDTLVIKQKQTPNISLGNDSSLCPGTVLPLDVLDTFASYTWSNGSHTHKIEVSTAGKYWLTVSNGVCDASDTVSFDYPETGFELGNDALLCKGEIVTLHAHSFPGSSYQWQDGSTTDTFFVDKQGIYWATATNVCGSYSDTIKVVYENCNCTPFIPTAFTPNADGLNDYILPILNCSAAKYKLQIANRFGQIVFKTTDPTQKWDGKFNGGVCDVGTYFYLLQLTGPRNKNFLFKGDITLVK